MELTVTSIDGAKAVLDLDDATGVVRVVSGSVPAESDLAVVIDLCDPGGNPPWSYALSRLVHWALSEGATLDFDAGYLPNDPEVVY